MKLSGIKRIIKDDFPPDVQQWIDILLYPLNQNLEQTQQIIDKNLTIDDNIVAAVKTLTLEGTSMLTADSTASSNILSNPSYYQASITNTSTGILERYGVQVGQKVDGQGVLPGTTITSIGTAITLSLPAQFTQLKGEFTTGGSFPFKFLHGLTSRPNVVLVAKIEDMAVLKAPLAKGVFVQWDLDGNNVVIKALTGLQAGKKYKVSFLIF